MRHWGMAGQGQAWPDTVPNRSTFNYLSHLPRGSLSQPFIQRSPPNFANQCHLIPKGQPDTAHRIYPLIKQFLNEIAHIFGELVCISSPTNLWNQSNDECMIEWNGWHNYAKLSRRSQGRARDISRHLIRYYPVSLLHALLSLPSANFSKLHAADKFTGYMHSSSKSY